MMLWEEGRFKLDDPVSKYIPEFQYPRILDTYDESDGSYTTIPAKNEIRVRHLLTHSSGLGYGMIDGNQAIKAIYKKAGIVDAWTTDAIYLSENIKKLATPPLVFEPGEKYRYLPGGSSVSSSFRRSMIDQKVAQCFSLSRNAACISMKIVLGRHDSPARREWDPLLRRARQSRPT